MHLLPLPPKIRYCLSAVALVIAALLLTCGWFGLNAPVATGADPLPPIIFVARSHLATPDTIFRQELGPAGQFGTGLTKFAPGSKLVRRNADGSLFVYVTPGLVDLQSPDVNFDATKIVFAGATTLIPETNNSGWRLYEINVDGSGFHQLTFSDRIIEIPNAEHFLNQESYGVYADLFPAYLADGRIVFASSRYPARAHYDERRTFNLYVINGDGSDLHRITSERGGFLHPTPLPDGRILATRWWNQFNQPSETGIYNRIDNAPTDQTLADGTVVLANSDETFNPAKGKLADGFEIRDAPNSWHLMALNPDGTGLQRYAWTPVARWELDTDSGFYDTYHATQPALVQQGETWLVAFTSQQDSTMVHTTLRTGIRVAYPGVAMIYANARDAIAGLTYQKAWEQDDTSPPYALHPWGLPDGRLLYSQTREDSSLPQSGQQAEGGHVYKLQGSTLRYELYIMDLDGNNKSAVAVDLAGINLTNADMMDAKPIVARTGWHTRADTTTAIANDDPRLGNLPNTLTQYGFSQRGPDEIQTATLHNTNIYANPALDLPYVNNSPPPGTVAKVQLWVDANQFTGAGCYDDWPEPCADFRQDTQVRAVLWAEAPVTPAGAFTLTVPADTPAFFVLRDGNGRVVRNWNRGYISIAQGNAWARPGETVTCTGCHMGHVSGSVDAVLATAAQGWTNVAPYAEVKASSFYDYNDPNAPDYQPFRPYFVNDRRGWIPVPAGGPPAPFGEESLLTMRNTVANLVAKVGGMGGQELQRRIDQVVQRPPQARDTLAATYQDDESSWLAAKGQAVDEWIELRWSQAYRISAIRLIGVPPNGGDWKGFGEPAAAGPYYVESGSLEFFKNGAAAGEAIAVDRVEPLENGGTTITLATPLEADRLRFTIKSISGRWWSEEIAALSEIEVTGMATAAATPPVVEQNEYLYLPLVSQ
ncbi:MAG: hypothetical protein R3C14_29540 [Caldilineaceae bacterium]